MKKICSLVLIFSFVFCFTVPCYADFTTTDSNHLTSIYQSVNSGGALYGIVNQIKNSVLSGGALYTLVNSINSNILSLFRWTSGSGQTYSVAQILNSIANDTYSLVNSSQGNNSQIVNLLGYSDNGVVKPWLADIYQSTFQLPSRLTAIYNLQDVYLPYLSQIYTVNNSNLPLIFSRLSYNNISVSEYLYNTMRLFDKNGYPNYYLQNPVKYYLYSNGIVEATGIGNSNSLIAGLWYNLMLMGQSLANIGSDGFLYSKSFQSFTRWDTLNNGSFAPRSLADGVYNWFSRVQTPLARLAFVHASDEEIAAREASAPNQNALVDNFIDSSGAASASVADIQSISGMSSGFKQNFSTGANPSSIFQIFSSSNWGWFSHETANQLDTTNSPTRLLRSVSTSFETPLLDEQIQGVYNFLGGN